jgi:hypothetical protein
MTMSNSWRQTLLHSAVVVLMATLAGVVHVFIENDLRLSDPILILVKIGRHRECLCHSMAMLQSSADCLLTVRARRSAHPQGDLQ